MHTASFYSNDLQTIIIYFKLGGIESNFALNCFVKEYINLTESEKKNYYDISNKFHFKRRIILQLNT